MTNYDKWLSYMRDVGSPQSYIDFSFYYMISVALQRRVWLGDEDAAIYPNTFIILVGGPGVGKGQVIGPVNDFLRSLKVLKARSSVSGEEVREAELDDLQLNGKTKKSHENYLFPLGADATTFEKLVQTHGAATRCVVQKTIHPVTGKAIVKTIVYASLCFMLEELASIIKKHQEATIDYLQTAYDCKDYTYETKHQGDDLIRKPSLCLLAGTNPDFMETTLNQKILNQGFAARTWMIYENAPRWHRYDMIRRDETQHTYRADILAHLRNLSTLYGECKLSPEADEFLKHWWEKIHPIKRVNMSAKLEYYYTRKKAHVWKLCMCLHFAESLSMTIEVATAKKALEMFDVIEEKMHFAVSFDNSNPLFALSRKVKHYLKTNGDTSRVELLMEFWGQANEAQLNETLSFLITTNKIEAAGNGIYRAKAS